MPVLTAPDEPTVLATSSPAAPLLRVGRRGDEHVRIVPVAVGKYTVGSSPQCQVCLPSPDVRPLQCLITLEANVATVTRWAPGVKLNGQEFSKAELHDRDRLTVGDWDVEFARGVVVSDDEPAAYDDGDLSFEATLDSLSELTLDEESESDELTTTPGTVPDAVAGVKPVIDWPIDVNATPVVEEVAQIVTHETPVAQVTTSVVLTSAPPATCLSSHAFADSLVLQLWTANDRARRRAKKLITGLRAARFQADALAADLAAIETELDLARAAYDSHLGNDDRLQQELAKQHEERVTPLLEEISSLQAEVEQAQLTISRQEAAYESLSGELAALQTAAKTPAIDPALAKRDEELEAAMTAQSQELEQLTAELRLARQEQEQLAERYQQEVDCRTQETARAASETARAESLQTAAAVHSQQLEQLASELRLAQQEQQRLTELHQLEAKRAAQFAQALLEQQALLEASATDVRTQDEPAAKLEPERAADDPWQAGTPDADEVAPTPAPSARQSAEAAPPPPVPEPPAVEYSTPSFIDKYRHLLETDDAPAQPAVAPKGSRPVIDDEFLSPAKAESNLSAADESDDALEAYMANMMRRMRSTSPTYESSQAAAALNESLLADAGPSRLSEPTALAEFVPEEPFNFEDMKNATRKTPLASNLAALREMANNSARTAIATHNRKQVRESAVTKVAIALTAAAASAYIMTSAPAIDAWQFWGGATTGVLGVGAAVQALTIERRSRVRSR